MIELELPPDAPEHIVKLRDELTDLSRRADDAVERAATAKAAAHQAPDSDREARAKALRAGQKDPGNVHTQAAQKALDDAKEEGAILAEAAEQTRRELRLAILEEAPAWRERIATERPARLEAFAEILSALDAESHALSASYAIAEWVERMETTGALAPYRVPGRRIEEMRKRSGEAFTLTEVVEAMRAMIEREGKPMPRRISGPPVSRGLVPVNDVGHPGAA